jgi:putative intracellular protease/amidase
LGFISSPDHLKMTENSKPIKDWDVHGFDAILFVGGQGPMYTFHNDERVHELAASFCEAGKITAAMQPASCWG